MVESKTTTNNFCVGNIITLKKMVIKTKSVEFMPFWLSVAGFLNAGVWTIYALMPFDPFMAVSFVLPLFHQTFMFHL